MRVRLESILTGVLFGAFFALVLGHALFSAVACAHFKAVATACKPAPSEVDTALADLQTDGWQAALDALAVSKTMCVARAAVQQVIDALSGSQALEMTGTPSSSDIVSRGKAWLTANPNKETR